MRPGDGEEIDDLKFWMDLVYHTADIKSNAAGADPTADSTGDINSPKRIVVNFGRNRKRPGFGGRGGTLSPIRFITIQFREAVEAHRVADLRRGALSKQTEFFNRLLDLTPVAFADIHPLAPATGTKKVLAFVAGRE